MTNKEAINILINTIQPPIIRNDGKSMAHLLALEAIQKAVVALEAEPIKHGHWIHGKELSRDYVGDVCVSIHYDKCWCSECNYPVEGQPLWAYCPQCGARMDESTMGQLNPEPQVNNVTIENDGTYAGG